MAEEYLIETARTWLRPLTVSDAADFYALNLDPEVVRYTGDGPFENEDAARAFLAKYDQYEKYRVGRWAVIEKAAQILSVGADSNTAQIAMNTILDLGSTETTGIKVLQQRQLRDASTTALKNEAPKNHRESHGGQCWLNQSFGKRSE